MYVCVCVCFWFDGISHSLAHGISHSLAHGISHSLAHGISHSLAHGISHSLAHGISHSLAHGISHSLAQCFAQCMYVRACVGAMPSLARSQTLATLYIHLNLPVCLSMCVHNRAGAKDVHALLTWHGLPPRLLPPPLPPPSPPSHPSPLNPPHT